MGKEGLASNKLPLVLAGVGGALGALGWLAQTDWLKSLLESWLNTQGTPGEDAVYDTITGGKPDSEGFLHWAHQIDKSNPMQTGADVTKFVNKFGAENVSHMFDGNGAGDSMDQIKQLQQLVGGENAGKSVGELFQSDTFGDMKGGRNLFGISKSASFVSKVLIKQAVKGAAGSAAGTILATKIAAIGSVLAPIGIGLITTGAIVKLMRMKGLRQSRAKTLNDLLQSLQPVEVGEATTAPVLPEPKPNPVQDGGSGKSGKDGLYNDLTKFFQFIVNNKKQLNTKGNLSGDALVSKKDRENKNENRMENMSLIIEGKFIKDKRTLEYLTKKSSLDKIKKFEEFLTRLEYIRNVVKKMSNTDDKVINNFVTKLKSNPIMATDFVKMFNVPSDNPKGVQSLKGFIDELFNTLYSGKNAKMFNMVDKMATLGGGNINKVEESYLHEDKGYNVDQPNKAFIKDAQDRTSFKKHLNNFIMGLMGMYQYMHKLKKEGKLGGNKESKPKQEKQEPQQESNNVLKKKELLEELNKIKRLMK